MQVQLKTSEQQWLTFQFLVLFLSSIFVNGAVPTTLEGPFKPVTVPLNTSLLLGNITDFPETDPRLRSPNFDFQPQQISVSLSLYHDSLWISWITGEYQIGEELNPLEPESVASVVQYGYFGSGLDNEAMGYSLVYSQLYPHQGLQNYTSGIIHHVLLTGLEPDTLYQYQCGDPSIPAMSNVLYFRTVPSESPNYPSRIAVVGDLGLTYNTSTTVNHLLSNHPDLFLLVGGVSFADLYLSNGTGLGCRACPFLLTPVEETYQPRWDLWGRFMQPLVANVPIMVVGGKHEIEEQTDNQRFVSYSSRFVFPSEESGSSSALYYSFNAGGIHFIMLSPYAEYDRSSDQYNWLESDLGYVDRSVTPWVVAAWDSPWYSSFKAHYRDAECMRVAMEDLLYTYGVDIVFNGRVHGYERSNRVYNYFLDNCGPVYFTIGAGGSLEGLDFEYADEPGNCPETSSVPSDSCGFNFTSGPASGKFCWDQQPDYSAYRESSFGHGILEVKNETHALWSWHRNQDSYLNAADIIYIVRQPESCFSKPKV